MLALYRACRTTGGDWHLFVLRLDHAGISINNYYIDNIKHIRDSGGGGGDNPTNTVIVLKDVGKSTKLLTLRN